MLESTKVLAIMQRLPRDSLAAPEVEWRGEPRQRPSHRLAVLTFPIRVPEQFLRQQSANARPTLGSQRARFSEQGFLDRYRDALPHDATLLVYKQNALTPVLPFGFTMGERLEVGGKAGIFPRTPHPRTWKRQRRG